jgi:hypothetical protein
MPAHSAPHWSTWRPTRPNARLSAELRARLAGHLDLADSETLLQKVDLFPARPRAKGPAQIFRDLILRAQGRRPVPPRPAQAAPAPLVDALTTWSTRSEAGSATRPPPINRISG